MKKVRWGILSTAKIGREKVIPAMQKGVYCDIVAIASRNKEQAQKTANALHIEKVYGSYEALLHDAEIDAVYIPLPNHLHVAWAIKAIQANKHVLCEKPVAMRAAQALQLLEAAKCKPHLKVMEAFMYRFHPQWQYAKKLVTDGRIGALQTVQSFFSYFNIDMDNIRNKKEAGGGGLMDIGCYCVSFARYLFNEEPKRVIAIAEQDPHSGTDRLTSAMLEFEAGTSTFTCSTQLMPYQRVNIVGTDGRIEIEVPVNAAPGKSCRIWLHQKSGFEEIVFDAVDQYTLQGDAFSKSVLENTPVPFELTDAVNNMKVIDAIFASAAENCWKNL